MRGENAAKILLTTCSNAKKYENILFVTDDTSKAIADIMWEASKDFVNRAMIVMKDRSMHGEEPLETVAVAMAASDLIFGITKFSMFHTNAIRNAVKNRSRFVNMADYSLEMMENGGLYADFIQQGIVLDRLSDKLEGETVHITTKLGTDLTASVSGRKAVRQYGRSLNPGDTSSPPNIEIALSPIEGTANGIVLIDGSIPHPRLGVLRGKIRLEIKNGKIVLVSGDKEAEILKTVLEKMKDDKAYLLAEIGIGLNNKSILCNRMLEDEGVMGTIHFGFGSNLSFGGNIESTNHLDMVFNNPTLSVDGRVLTFKGELTV